jgi:hypothetical protein
MHRWLGFVPVFISLFWVVFIVATQAAYCKPPQADEGTAAHLFQILMVAQIPIVIGFVLTKGVRPLRRILPMLALQATAWGAAALTARLMT